MMRAYTLNYAPNGPRQALLDNASHHFSVGLLGIDSH